LKKYWQFIQKNSLESVLLGILLIIVLLSWFIYPGRFHEGVFVLGDEKKMIGVFDLIKLPYITIATSIHIVLYVLIIGGLYGVLNKTKVYQQVVMYWADKLGDKVVLIVTILLISLSSLTGNLYLLFVLVPFFVALILYNKYDMLTAFAATVGAIIIGNSVALFHTVFSAAFSYYYRVDVFSFLFEKIIVFLIVLAGYSLWVNKKKKTANEQIPLFEKVRKKKQELTTGFLLFSSVFVGFLFLVMYDWVYVFGISFFEDLSKRIKDLPVLGNLLGDIPNFGFWGIYELLNIIIIFIILIVFIFNIKLKDAYQGFISGVKSMVKPALYMGFVFFTYYLIAHLQGGINIYYAIVNQIILMTKNFELVGYGLIGFISLIFYNNLAEYVYNTTLFIDVVEVSIKPVIPLVLKSFYALGMFILPTSLFLVGGLVYLKINYFDWLKYIYRFVLILFILNIGFLLLLANL